MLWWSRKPKKKPIKNDLLAHVGGPCDDAHTIAHQIKTAERVNLQLALDRLLAASGPSGRLLGYVAEYMNSDSGLSNILGRDDAYYQVGPVEREQLARSPTEQIDCVTRGIYLLRWQGSPLVGVVRTADSWSRDFALELMARERGVAQAVLEHLLNEIKRENVYRGRTLSLEPASRGDGGFVVQFHELPEARREAIVLPDAVLRVVERNVLGMLRHGETLRKSGRSTRHGLLFHGKPGTGKTLVARYLARACADHTVILLSGRQMGMVRESCQMARLLAPSIVILEDVDLIAEDREENKCPVLLHELLDEMDGIGTRTDCIFILTTNRPDVLESALAARPGRIDQAVEFPLPDEECRRRLFELYGHGLDLSGVELGRWVAQTEGASPAFLEELLRKAALMAAERGENSEPLRLTDEDVGRAVKELVFFGGELTQRLLGFRPSGIGYRTSGVDSVP
jgi:hypothetical protein